LIKLIKIKRLPALRQEIGQRTQTVGLIGQAVQKNPTRVAVPIDTKILFFLIKKTIVQAWARVRAFNPNEWAERFKKTRRPGRGQMGQISIL
jgi:hypothetical protein